ncbi:hypothetical protein DPM33_33480 [Mesorhizobium hawassense]|uniref:Uncharacterized protein n=1 Tax=Mesorhizobium hawassense TaxID=1209954 RepID=A0A330H8P6_9HYPH|nr:hypothetical protein DPM33_33480 [Mesorhizobium hawassense]
MVIGKIVAHMRLSLAERQRAPRLAEILVQAAGQLNSGESVQCALRDGREAILAAGFSKVEYLELRAIRPRPYTHRSPARLLVAAWLGQTRLIDKSSWLCRGLEVFHQAAARIVGTVLDARAS